MIEIGTGDGYAEQARLYRELADIETDHQRRYFIGERLAQIGDTRPGTGVKDGLPDIAWLSVDDSDGPYAFAFGTFAVKPFYIARYLTTVAQFQAFADSGAYDDPHWWEGFPTECQPQAHNVSKNSNANAPHDTVSWYQAVAFGRWLTVQCDGLVLAHPSGISLRVGENAVIRLPAEWEWQWAAQGDTEARTYPWGKWDDQPRANTGEAGVNERSSAVGMYPHGTARCGALDMAGNLWEWCQSQRSDTALLNGYATGESKVLRGGSFYEPARDAAAAYSNQDFPIHMFYRFGFRLVVGRRVETL